MDVYAREVSHGVGCIEIPCVASGRATLVPPPPDPPFRLGSYVFSTLSFSEEDDDDDS